MILESNLECTEGLLTTNCHVYRICNLVVDLELREKLYLYVNLQF